MKSRNLNIAIKINSKRGTIALILLVGIAGYGLSFLPYFNIVISRQLLLYLVPLCIIVVLSPSFRYIIWLTIVLFILSFFVTLLGLESIAELVGNCIFVLLVTASVFIIKEISNNI